MWLCRAKSLYKLKLDAIAIDHTSGMLSVHSLLESFYPRPLCKMNTAMFGCSRLIPGMCRVGLCKLKLDAIARDQTGRMATENGLMNLKLQRCIQISAKQALSESRGIECCGCAGAKTGLGKLKLDAIATDRTHGIRADKVLAHTLSQQFAKPRKSHGAGAKVGLCELKLDAIATDQTGGMGGTCVLRGCIPKKFMVYAGEFTDECEDAKAYGCETFLPSPAVLWRAAPEHRMQHQNLAQALSLQ